jgi:hypothetical protein
VEELM